MRIAKGLAQSDRKRLSKIIFLFNPFLTHTKMERECGLVRVVWIPVSLTQRPRPGPQVLPSHHGAYGRETEEVPAARNRRLPHARTPHLGAGPSSLSPSLRLRPCRPHSPYARLVLPRTAAADPTYSLKPRPPPRTKLEVNNMRATRHHHDGVCSSPAAPCVSNLWNSGTTFRMPCGPLAPRAGSRGNVVLLLRDFGRLV